MTDLTVLSASTETAVSIDLAKDFLGIGHDGEDALVGELLQAASARLEQASGIVLLSQIYALRWLQWPSEIAGRGARLLRRPVQTLVSVVVEQEDGSTVEHTERFKLECGRLRLRPWSFLPPIVPTARAKVEFVAGYGGTEAVPADLREATLRLVASMYMSRPVGTVKSGMDPGIPEDVQAILRAHDQVRL